jgi:threonine/homoserine/homoserine lactone efflux protein
MIIICVLPFLFSGLILGITAGISPGPLLALVISETLKQNRAGGVRVALAPLITDLPIIIFSIFIISKISGQNIVLGVISFSGALFIAYLGFDCVRTKGMEVSIDEKKTGSLIRGAAANFLSPHPYLFWITVGAPVTLKAYKTGFFASIIFLSAFYFSLVGSKIIIALLVDKSRNILQNKVYIRIMKGMGIVLLVFALLFVKEGIGFLMK